MWTKLFTIYCKFLSAHDMGKSVIFLIIIDSWLSSFFISAFSIDNVMLTWKMPFYPPTVKKFESGNNKQIYFKDGFMSAMFLMILRAKAVGDVITSVSPTKPQTSKTKKHKNFWKNKKIKETFCLIAWPCISAQRHLAQLSLI